jgi:hypothetical protein
MTKRYEWTEKSGSGGTSDYNDLTNKPQLQGTTLQGDKTANDLGLATKAVIPSKQLYTGSSGNFLNAILDFSSLNVGYFEGFTVNTTAYVVRVSDIPISLGGTPNYTFYVYWLGCTSTDPDVLTFKVNCYGPAYSAPLNQTGTILWTYTRDATSITWVNINPTVQTYKITGFSYWPWATTGKGSVFSDDVAQLLSIKIFLRGDPRDVSDVVTTENAIVSSSSDIGSIAVRAYEKYSSIDYDNLLDKPQIQGITLQGNKLAGDLGLATQSSVDQKSDIYLDPPTEYSLASVPLGFDFLGAHIDFSYITADTFASFDASVLQFSRYTESLVTYYPFYFGLNKPYSSTVYIGMVNAIVDSSGNITNGKPVFTYDPTTNTLSWDNEFATDKFFDFTSFSEFPDNHTLIDKSVTGITGVSLASIIPIAGSSLSVDCEYLYKHPSGGSGDYNALDNKPSIDGVTLVGNQVADSLGLASKGLVESLDGDMVLLRTDVDAIQENVSDLQSNKSDIYRPIVPESISLADLPVGYDFIGKTIDFSSITASLFESVSDVDVIRLDRYDAGGINNQVYQAFALGSISNHTVAGYVDCYVSTIMGVTEISGGTPVFLYSNTSHTISWQGDFATNKTYTFTAFNLYPTYTTMTDKIIEGSTATQISTLITMSAGQQLVTADCESNYHRIVGLENSYPTITSDQIASGVQGEDGVVYRYISSDPTETFRYAVWSPIDYPDWGVGAYMYVVFNPLSGKFMETAIMHGQIPYADSVAIRSFANAKQLSVPSYPPVGGYGWLAYKHETSGMRFVTSDLTPMDFDEYNASDKSAKYGPLGSTFFVTQGNTLKAAKIVYNTDVQTQGYKVLYYSTATSVINCAVSLTPGSTVIVAGVGYYAAPVVGSIMQIFTT